MSKRNIIIFFPGLFITLLGSALFSFASGLYLLDITGKSSTFATNIMFFTLPTVFLFPLMGILVDKLPKKLIILLGDFLNGILMLSIFFYWNRFDKVFLIYLGTGLSSILSSTVSLAFEAGKPQMFQKDWLLQANSYTTIISSLCRVGAPFLGGVVYSFSDMRTFILVNGISFFISMAFEIFLNIKNDKNSEENLSKKSTIKSIIAEGYNYFKNHQDLKVYSFLFLVANFAFGMIISVPVPFLINNHFALGSQNYGIIQSFSAIGMIAGAFLVKRLKPQMGFHLFSKTFFAIILAGLIFSLPLFISINSLGIIFLYSLAMVIFGLAISGIDIPMFTYCQINIPEEIRGQVMGYFISAVKLVVPLTLLLSGKIVDNISPFMSIAIGMGFLFLFILKMRVSQSEYFNEEF